MAKKLLTKAFQIFWVYKSMKIATAYRSIGQINAFEDFSGKRSLVSNSFYWVTSCAKKLNWEYDTNMFRAKFSI